MKKLVFSVVGTLSLMCVNNLSASEYYATVNGEKITKEDVSMVIQDPRVKFDSLPQNAQKQVLEQIINKKLLAKYAFEKGIEKDSTYINALNRVKEDLAFQVWQKNEVASIKVSEKEQKEFFDKNKDEFKVPTTLEARHILVKTEAEAKDLIKQLDKAKNKEESFIELAKTKSTGPSGPQGGDLGKFQAKQMVPEFSKAALELKANEYSKKPVKTQFGWHVIYLKNKTEGKSLSFNEVKGNISKILISNQYNKKVKEIADDLRKKAKIVIK